MYAESYNEYNLPPEILVGNAIDLRGKRFGRLTVLYRCKPPSTVSKKTTQTYWLCRCDCGKYIATRTGALNTNGVKSCGCLQKEKAAMVKPNLGKVPYNKKDLTGQLFGYLSPESSYVIDHVTYWHCKCKCGLYRDVKTTDLTSGKVVSCGCQSMSRGALTIKTWLENHQIEYKQEYVFNDLYGINNGQLRFDFAIFERGQIKYLIEFQGEQHYDTTNPWYTNAMIENDKLKKQYCKSHDYKLIEILYNENVYKRLEEILN